VYVAVVGPGSGATSEECATAHETGRLLGAAGAIVLTGGLGGVMAAATEGAAAAGGLTVALQPGETREPSVATVVLPTGLGELRNGVLVRCADAVIAVGGSWGTLSEIALARRAGVPVVALGGWELPELERAATPAAAVERVLSHRS
jgi:uncharacterized protein (TIGR00725 family)